MTVEPPSAAPDAKDWTWVLNRPCPDCGYRADTPHADIPGLIRSNVMRWQAVLTLPAVALRPAADVWSPLEYACHVRDVYRVFGRRLAQLQTVMTRSSKTGIRTRLRSRAVTGQRNPAKRVVS